VKQYAINKTGHRVVFIKLGPKHASKDEIELSVFKVLEELLLAFQVLGLLRTVRGSESGVLPCSLR
jgi:hypothetical protein